MWEKKVIRLHYNKFNIDQNISIILWSDTQQSQVLKVFCPRSWNCLKKEKQNIWGWLRCHLPTASHCCFRKAPNIWRKKTGHCIQLNLGKESYITSYKESSTSAIIILTYRGKNLIVYLQFIKTKCHIDKMNICSFCLHQLQKSLLINGFYSFASS